MKQLGAIENLKEPSKKGKKLLQSYERNTMAAEQFRMVRANIKFVLRDQDIKTILFTSTTIGEGKSTISSNLAISFAQEGKKVLLVDADLRKPTVHHTFNTNIFPGLTNYLKNDSRLQDIIKTSITDDLDIITSGLVAGNPVELLDSLLMEKFLDEVKEYYDLIILDTPPLLLISDAQLLSNKCDGTILVLSSGKTERRDLLKAQSMLKASGANVVGVILNNLKLEKSRNGYYSD